MYKKGRWLNALESPQILFQISHILSLSLSLPLTLARARARRSSRILLVLGRKGRMLQDAEDCLRRDGGEKRVCGSLHLREVMSLDCYDGLHRLRRLVPRLCKVRI